MKQPVRRRKRIRKERRRFRMRFKMYMARFYSYRLSTDDIMLMVGG